MLKQFIKDSFVYGISGIITRGITIFLVPFYTRVLSPADYGIIDLIAIISSIVIIIFPLQITQAIARFYPDCKTEKESKEFASTALFFSIITFSIFLILIQIYAIPLSKTLLENHKMVNILRVAGLSIFINGMFYFVQNQLRWRLEPKKHMICSLTFSLITVVLSIYFVLIIKTGIIGVFWARVIGGLIGLIFGFYFSRSSYFLFFNTSRLKNLLSFCLPLVPSVIGVYLLNYIDRISIKSLMTLSDLGLYGIGFRVASVVGLIMLGIHGSLTPLIYSKYKEKNTPAQLSNIFRYVTFAGLIIIAILSIFSKEILIILTTPDYYSAYIIIPFLVFSVFISNMNVFSPGLAIAKKTKYIAIINIAGAFLNIGLNLLLILQIGILGAAIATLISSVLVFIAKMYFSQKNYFIPYDFKLILFTVIITVILIFLGVNITINNILYSIIFKSGIIVFTIFILMKIGLFNFKENKYFINQIKYKIHNRIK